jgi:hypothetical protein
MDPLYNGPLKELQYDRLIVPTIKPVQELKAANDAMVSDAGSAPNLRQ